MTPMILDHPLIQHKLSLLRNKHTGSKEFRELDGERMLVVHIFGKETQILTLSDHPDKAVGVSGEVKLQRGDASSKLLMGAWSSVVFAL